MPCARHKSAQQFFATRLYGTAVGPENNQSRSKDIFVSEHLGRLCDDTSNP